MLADGAYPVNAHGKEGVNGSSPLEGFFYALYRSR